MIIFNISYSLLLSIAKYTTNKTHWTLNWILNISDLYIQSIFLEKVNFNGNIIFLVWHCHTGLYYVWPSIIRISYFIINYLKITIWIISFKRSTTTYLLFIFIIYIINVYLSTSAEVRVHSIFVSEMNTNLFVLWNNYWL